MLNLDELLGQVHCFRLGDVLSALQRVEAGIPAEDALMELVGVGDEAFGSLPAGAPYDWHRQGGHE